jgi:hypothetical protein
MTAVAPAGSNPIIIAPTGSSYSFNVRGSDSDDSGIKSVTVTTHTTAFPVTSPSLSNQQRAGSSPPQTAPAAGEAPGTAQPHQAPTDVPGFLLFVVEENILKMSMVAGATCIGIALVIWYGKQTKWK